MRIAMWSGPRNLSTAMMYAFGARPDTAVWDEPFYAPWLAATGAAHPMRDRILARHETDAATVSAACAGPAPDGRPVFYQKHMCHHMLDAFDRGFMRGAVNVFLIRHPARVIASYAAKVEDVTAESIGIDRQWQLYAEVAGWSDAPPPVVDSADIRANPESVLSALCARIGLPFDRAMLSWPAGGHPADGAWADHWYGAVRRSTGFDGPEAPVPQVAPEHRSVLDAALPVYERLRALSLTA